ncbi:MAG TPA: choice-of-anchor tandem repeat GloVer-containing protein [Bryobacteraceae bacterium]|nr:choice-of-anchor tandem repeat GloVer-containing protein [Bryobacteraceae bacterium]
MKRIVNAYAVLALFAVISLPAQTFTTLHTFDGTDGANPWAGLVQATNGSLYGTTSAGGANSQGTAFKIAPSGALTTLYSFCSQSGCTDGADPVAGLVQATNEDFYGTTLYGGANNAGTIFKITPGGALTTLYSFCSQSNCADGSTPYAGLVQTANGYLYGTTFSGGANGNYGTVFRITPSGTLATIYSFCPQTGCVDGEGPVAGLVQAASGDLYGTTEEGGANAGGTIFQINPASGTLTTLYAFCSQTDCADGVGPEGGLIQAANGDLLGTAGGGTEGEGVVFSITPTGTLTRLHSFCYHCGEGTGPRAGLVRATDGDLYGTTVSGGARRSYGTAFKITPSGALTTIYSFCSQSGCIDGSGPYAPLVQATNGSFYGTTAEGGADSACANGCGTIFSLSVGLGPFVETQTTSGEVGVAVKILGSDLAGATSVTFNGTAATFTVVSSYLITATVPAGATSGRVEVVTPSGTLSSNMAFRVP